MEKIIVTYFLVKTEKKTVQFGDEVQVETIEPEPEQAYIDEVSDFLPQSTLLIEVEMVFFSSLKKFSLWLMHYFVVIKIQIIQTKSKFSGNFLSSPLLVMSVGIVVLLRFNFLLNLP